MGNGEGGGLAVTGKGRNKDDIVTKHWSHKLGGRKEDLNKRALISRRAGRGGKGGG